MVVRQSEVRQQQRETANTISTIVARHLGLDPSQVSNWTKLGANVLFIIADVEDVLGPAKAKRTFSADDDLVSLLAAYQPE